MARRECQHGHFRAQCADTAGRHTLLGRLARGLLGSGVLGLCVCVALAVPVFAFASQSSQTVTLHSGGYSQPGFASSTATCPAGQHVLFGGYQYGYAGMRRTSSNQWTVDGWIPGSPPPGPTAKLPLTSYAYCGPGALASKATNTKVIRKFGSVTAQCPVGSVVVAGGFATTPHTAYVVTQLERVAANSWRVSAGHTTAYGISHTALTAIAYCQPGPAPKLVSSTRSSSGTARATCPAGTSLVFGGMVTKGSTSNPQGVAAAVWILRAETTNRWSAGGGVFSNDGSLTALAYCR